jgi:hypothetical protein
MRAAMAEKSFASQRGKLLKEFDALVKRIRWVFIRRYGEETARTMIAETRNEYEKLIPELPWVGGKQPLTQFVIATGWFLGMYRVLKKKGISIEEIGRLVYDASLAYIESYPGLILKIMGFMNFSRRYLEKLKKRAAESHLRRFPRDYVFNYVEGDGITFDYGVDYLECASCKFLKAQGAMELAPYLCAIDQIYSDKFGWGLTRTMTLAEGYEKCDFRFKKDAPTRIKLPKGISPSSTGSS